MHQGDESSAGKGELGRARVPVPLPKSRNTEVSVDGDTDRRASMNEMVEASAGRSDIESGAAITRHDEQHARFPDERRQSPMEPETSINALVDPLNGSVLRQTDASSLAEKKQESEHGLQVEALWEKVRTLEEEMRVQFMVDTALRIEAGVATEAERTVYRQWVATGVPEL